MDFAGIEFQLDVDSYVVRARDRELADTIMDAFRNATSEADFMTKMTKLIVDYRQEIEGV